MDLNVPFGSGGWKYAFVPFADWATVADPAYDDSAWAVGTGIIATSGYTPLGPFVDGATTVAGSSAGVQTDAGVLLPGYSLAVRRWFPPGTGITIDYDEYNYAELWVNGVDVGTRSTGNRGAGHMGVPDGGNPTEPWVLCGFVYFGNGTFWASLDFEVTGTPTEPDPDPDPEVEPATQVVGQRVGELGCGEYKVLVMNRCGNQQICELTDSVSKIEGNPFRVMDDTSQVVITVDLTGTEDAVCCACLGDTRSWIHSIIIQRNDEIVWGPGPIVNMLYRREQVEVTARDVSAWLDRRVIHNDYDFFDDPLPTVVRTLLEDALGPDDPCGLLDYLTIEDSTRLIELSVTANEGSAGDVLRDMARNYLDYTVIGQRIVIADELTYGPFSKLSDGDFQTELEIEERGLETGTKWYINGDGSEGTAGGTSPYLGLIEQVATEDTLEDDDTATASATARLQASNPSPVYINVPAEAQLATRAHINFKQLIPGTLVDVVLENVCRPLAVRQRLTAMTINVSGDGEELVGVTLSPLGTGIDEAGGTISA